MLVSGEKIRKKIEDKFNFKFKSLKIIGYFNKNKDSNGKTLSTIICKSLNLKSNLSSIFFLIFSPLTNIIYNSSPLH